MVKYVRYEIERTTHGIDRYYVELQPDEDQSEQHAIDLIMSGEVPLDFHEDTEWGPFRVTDRDEMETEDDDI